MMMSYTRRYMMMPVMPDLECGRDRYGRDRYEYNMNFIFISMSLSLSGVCESAVGTAISVCLSGCVSMSGVWVCPVVCLYVSVRRE
jgi:hypothetical protein